MDAGRVGSLNSSVFEEIVSLSSQGLLIVDASGPRPTILHANPAWLTRSGYALAELAGSDWLALTGLGEQSAGLTELQKGLAAAEPFRLGVPWFHRNGELWISELSLAPLTSASDQHLWLIQHETEKRSAAGDRDPAGRAAAGSNVTARLLSRTQFEMHCRRELGVARREQRPLSLMLWVVPELNTYRETFGPKAADSCLRMIATQITGTFRRGSDLCALFDEATLAVVIPGLSQEQADRRVASVESKVRNLTLHNPHGRLSRYIAVRGVAVQPETPESIEALFARAMEAIAAGSPDSEQGLAACV